MRIGFTGTRKGMTDEQEEAFYLCLGNLTTPGDEFHHGDCVGADEEATKIAYALALYIVSHPPLLTNLRAFTKADWEWEPAPYLERNQDIINESDILFAAPGEMQEKLRSGTWSTIRKARKSTRVIIIYPDGTTEE